MRSRRGPLRILCADDNELLGEVLLSVFAAEGYWVEQVDNGEAAWRRLEDASRPFDVLITDHDMPRLNGLRLVKLVRQAGKILRVIVHTSGLYPEQIEQYQALGVTSIVMKGSRPEVLLNAVRAVAESAA